mgnify:CR=1 FL=1
MESQKKYDRTFSFEFFPPRTPEAAGKLQMTQERLAKLHPSFFSVTFGAGGSTRERTLETVLDIREKTGIEGVPHLSCIGTMAEDIRQILQQYLDNDIHHLVALRGLSATRTNWSNTFARKPVILSISRSRVTPSFIRRRQRPKRI